MRTVQRTKPIDSPGQILRLDAGHFAERDSSRASSADRRVRVPLAQPTAIPMAASASGRSDRLRVWGSNDRATPPGGWVLRRFRHNFSTLSHLVRDPLLCYADDGAVLSQLRETLHLTESALRQFELGVDDPAAPAEAILAIANVVEERVDGLFERLEQLTALRQRLFRFSATLETVPAGLAPRLHEIEEIATWLIDAAREDDQAVTLLDPESTRPALRVAAHALNVAQVAVRLAMAAPTWFNELTLVVEAALLQDLGMMRVPLNIFGSSELLTPTQRAVVGQHPGTSASIVAQMHGHDARLIQAVAQHHERLNGSGYPDHLCGQAVGPVARLLGVADSYVGIQSPRPYRPALNEQQALVELDRASLDGRLDPAWTCRLGKLTPHWLKIPVQPEPPSGAPAVSALAA